MPHTSELEQFFSKRTVLERRDQSHLQVGSCSQERLDIPPSKRNALPSFGVQQNSRSTCMEPNLSWRQTIVHFSTLGKPSFRMVVWCEGLLPYSHIGSYSEQSVAEIMSVPIVSVEILWRQMRVSHRLLMITTRRSVMMYIVIEFVYSVSCSFAYCSLLCLFICR